MEIGDRIAFLRQRQNLTYKELGDKAGVSANAIHKWEHGYTKSIKVDYVIALANALDTTVEYLMGYVDDPHEKLRATNFTDEEEELLRIFRTLDLRGRHALLSLAWELEK